MAVKWFSHDMFGAPSIEEQTSGALIALLKACLFNGFGDQTPSSLTWDGSLVTVTYGTAHGLQDWQIIDVSGATQAEYNGQHRVRVVDAVTVTYVPALTPAVTPATGTITTRTPPIGGWEIVDEDVPGFRLAIRSLQAAAADTVIVINNNGNQGLFAAGNEFIATFDLADAFVDVDTYNQISRSYWPAGYRYATEDWILIGDEQLFYWNTRFAQSQRRSCMLAGSINSWVTGDQTHCVINGVESSSSAEWDSTTERHHANTANLNSDYLRTIAYDYTQTTPARPFSLRGIGDYSGGSNGIDFPNPATNELVASPTDVVVVESSSIRGTMPGLVQLLNGDAAMHAQVYDNLPAYNGIPVMLLSTQRSATNANLEHPIGVKLENWR